MSMTDTVSDMLTRMRNSLAMRKEWVDVLNSKLNQGVADVLLKEGYIHRFQQLEGASKRYLRVYLKYGPEGENLILHIQRVSKPGRRIYRSYKELKPVLHGMGIQIVSTPKGIMADRDCKEKQLGGEVLARVY